MIPLPIDEPLKTYFAVQLLPKEGAHTIAKVILQTARDESILFRRLEVLDTASIGSTTFVRVRSDLINPFPILDKLHSSGRAVISSTANGEYAVRFSGGRTGKVSNLLMHAEARLGQSRMYRGTKIKRWEAQFEAA